MNLTGNMDLQSISSNPHMVNIGPMLLPWMPQAFIMIASLYTGFVGSEKHGHTTQIICSGK
jgi:hypothetical protein